MNIGRTTWNLQVEALRVKTTFLDTEEWKKCDLRSSGGALIHIKVTFLEADESRNDSLGSSGEAP